MINPIMNYKQYVVYITRVSPVCFITDNEFPNKSDNDLLSEIDNELWLLLQ